MALRTVQFLAILCMAFALIPAGAHVFELPNKMGLDREAYFTVQGIYAGWALFGIVLIGGLILNLILAIMLRAARPAFYFALIGFVALAATLLIFFVWVFPTNQATANWTEIPENWEALRRQWEYGHAVNAVITLVGFCSVVLAALTSRG